MEQTFIDQDYLIIENNVVTNVVTWNGDTSIWTPPQGSIALVKSTTPVMVWEPVKVDGKTIDWVLVEVVGSGSIGFTWDGSVLTTNEPKPKVPTPPLQESA
jgi:hypothetical protein